MAHLLGLIPNEIRWPVCTRLPSKCCPMHCILRPSARPVHETEGSRPAQNLVTVS